MANDPVFSLEGKRVWVAGHRGMVGAAIIRGLAHQNCVVLTVERKTVDLRDQAAVKNWVAREKPEVIFLAAARVGGILANKTYPADFLYENLMIEANIIEASHSIGASKLLFLGSSCIYPRMASQPIAEDALLTGPLETTNEWYAIAKIAGIKLCQAYRTQYGVDFISAMPTNLYGPGDNFDLNSSHVIPAIIRKAHEAKITDAPELNIWGTGSALREFMHVDDCANACIHLMKSYSASSHVNVGSGQELSIAKLAEVVCQVVGYRGKIIFDALKPDGTPRKLLDSSRLYDLGWRPEIPLETGLSGAYHWYMNSLK